MTNAFYLAILVIAGPAFADFSDSQTYKDEYGFSVNKPIALDFIRRKSGNGDAFVENKDHTRGSPDNEFFVAFGGVESRPRGDKNPAVFVKRIEGTAQHPVAAPLAYLRGELDWIEKQSDNFKTELAPEDAEVAGAPGARAEYSVDMKDGLQRESRAHFYLWAFTHAGKLYVIIMTCNANETGSAKVNFDEVFASIRLEEK